MKVKSEIRYAQQLRNAATFFQIEPGEKVGLFHGGKRYRIECEAAQRAFAGDRVWDSILINGRLVGNRYGGLSTWVAIVTGCGADPWYRKRDLTLIHAACEAS